MKTDVNGCSAVKDGEEDYQMFSARGKVFVQYDYKTVEGKPFFCVCATLEKCRIKRDEWLVSLKEKMK
jgi:hypothetical protein